MFTRFRRTAISRSKIARCVQVFLALTFLSTSAWAEQTANAKVLQWMELGVEAFKARQFNRTEMLFDNALLNIESVYADNEAASKARSLWYSEDNKDFKGEPYERSMAYYYRGLTYLYRSEYDNARASFLGGLLQDAFAEEDQHRSDFASLMFLSAWSARLMGSDYLSKDGFEELLIYRPDFPIPPASHNTLIVLETGGAPRKLADGIGHYELVYRRGKGIDGLTAFVSHGGQQHRLYPVEDLYYQASTRGGRHVDRIIKGKAVFRSNQANVGSGLSEAANTAVVFSEAFDNSQKISNIAGAVSLIGVAAQVIGANVNARADTRYWSNLPGMLNVLTMQLTPDVKSLKFDFIDEFDDVVPELSQSADVIWDAKGHAIVWLRVDS